MTVFSDAPLSLLNQLFFIVILNLIPLLTWAIWELDRRRRTWLSRREGREVARR